MIEVTRILSEWAHSLKYEDIPHQVTDKAKEQLMSIIGAIYAGIEFDGVSRLIQVVKNWGDKEESTIIGGGYKTSMRNAGLVNSVSAQILEFDDWVWASHTGAAAVPTVLAVGEALGASGKEVMTAQVIANEIAGRTGEAIATPIKNGNAIPNHQIDTAISAGKLMGLNQEEMMDAVGNSCIQAQVTSFIGWSGYAKGLLTGMPVYTGITSANLAQGGFGGNHNIIEHPMGFAYTVSADVNLEAMVSNLGREWRMKTLTTKPYPICGYFSVAIDCILELVNNNEISPEEIEEVEVKCPLSMLMVGTLWKGLPDLYERIKEKRDWTYIPLLFDSYYPLAAAIVDGELTPRQYREERIFDEQIHRLIPKIKLIPDAIQDIRFLRSHQMGAKVAIITKKRKRLSKSFSAMKGSPGRPFSVEEKLTKYLDKEKDKNKILEKIRHLEKIKNIRELMDLLI